MCEFALKKSHEVAVENAEPSIIVGALSRLQAQLVQGRWLSRKNFYSKNTVLVLDHVRKNGGSIHPHHLQDYIAASGPIHCLDGWAYLSQSILSHIRGDVSGAVHLAYYAELRAAASLLAAQAIGVMNNVHIAFDKSGSPTLINESRLGTHQFAWQALTLWSGQPNSALLLGRIIAPGDVTLTTWLDEFSTAITTNAIARSWLTDWGIDLQLLSKDQYSRNDASYRPTTLGEWNAPTPVEASRVLREFWRLFEPNGRSGFSELDRFLLRRALEAAFLTITGRSHRRAPADFRRRIRLTVERLVPPGRPASEWVDFLTRANTPEDPLLLTDAGERAPPGSKRHHLQVMARAALLLRLATGAVSDALSRSRCSMTDLQFWWDRVGSEAGLWDPSLWSPIETGTSMSDMWADVEIALEDLQAWEADSGSSSASARSWHMDNAASLFTLSGCQRIGLWGLST